MCVPIHMFILKCSQWFVL